VITIAAGLQYRLMAIFTIAAKCCQQHTDNYRSFVAFGDCGCAMANFSKYRVWDKAPEKSTIILEEKPNFLKTHCRGKPVCKKTELSVIVQPFRYTAGV